MLAEMFQEGRLAEMRSCDRFTEIEGGGVDDRFWPA
jgi:hypothetical protein